jgi:hypothetical protein
MVKNVNFTHDLNTLFNTLEMEFKKGFHLPFLVEPSVFSPKAEDH